MLPVFYPKPSIWNGLLAQLAFEQSVLLVNHNKITSFHNGLQGFFSKSIQGYDSFSIISFKKIDNISEQWYD